MDLSNLKPAEGSVKNRKRIARIAAIAMTYLNIAKHPP